MDTRRLVLFIIFSISTLMLWDAWQKNNTRTPSPIPTQTANSEHTPASTLNSFKVLDQQNAIVVNTDLYQVGIDLRGGDIHRLALLKHQQSDNKQAHLILLDDRNQPVLQLAQAILEMDNGISSHQAVFQSSASSYELAKGENQLKVRLTWQTPDASVEKVYTFVRGQYTIQVDYNIHNMSAQAIHPTLHYQIIRNDHSEDSQFVSSFTGAGYFSQASKFQKLEFDELKKEDLLLSSKDGWIGMLEHYFVNAWLLPDSLMRTLYSHTLSAQQYVVGMQYTASALESQKDATLSARLFAGPKIESVLKQAGTGLEYTIDYGWLTLIASPLFWLLSHIHSLVNNWGIAIILLTVLIKLAFFKLSATSYRSMAHLRELAPRLQQMKEQFGDDKQKMHLAMMELYKKEKINPMGGCLPILVQIPVFIAFYWMLLASVELRHAPFFGWISDLSAKDPYYILPILMGITMIIQTHLNPKPTDPIQAKVVTWMPLIFSVMFLFFPAGLVLYWLVNNILSIAQQWYINRQMSLHH